MKDHAQPLANAGKFVDPHITADGQERAKVALSGLQTLWFNTGTLCNITCVNCYIESSPTNDALIYLTPEDVAPYLDEATTSHPELVEIGFTGGEPFMNPHMAQLARMALEAGYRVLILTNAMLPMQRKSVKEELRALQDRFGDRLVLRISIDHWSESKHDEVRGKGGFAKTLQGMRWLRDQGIAMDVAGRSLWDETDSEARAGYQALFQAEGFEIDAFDPSHTVLFPEMDETVEVPEITTGCWSILNKSPQDVMCSNSRMVVRRKGEAHATVLACTLLPYAPAFDMGPTLKDAARDVSLNHPHCAKFCVLGGASCSA